MHALSGHRHQTAPQDLSGLRVHQMGLGARKARHLDVGEVIVFASISGPSELVIKVRSLRRQSVMPSRFFCS
jgi:hypothetical protein